MAQPSSHDQLSIQEVPNILKVARQNAALGLYPDSIRSYRHALHVVAEHIKSLADPFLKEQWKKADEEVKGEVEGIYKLYKALKVLRGEPGTSGTSGSSGPSASKEAFPAVQNPDERPIKVNKAPSAEGRMPKPPPSVLERFGGQPFLRKDEQAGQIVAGMARREDPPAYHHYPSGPLPPAEPKKDPMVWDPPSPKYQQPAPRKPVAAKKLPKWAQPKAPGPASKHAAGAAKPQPYHFFIGGTLKKS